MMDMETVLPRTCTMCYGTGVVSWLASDGSFDREECECQYKGENNG